MSPLWGSRWNLLLWTWNSLFLDLTKISKSYFKLLSKNSSQRQTESGLALGRSWLDPQTVEALQVVVEGWGDWGEDGAAFIEPWPRSGPRDQRSGDCRGLGRENVWNGRRLKPGRNMLHRLAWREFVLMWHGCSTDWPIVIFSEPSQDEAVWYQI